MHLRVVRKIIVIPGYKGIRTRGTQLSQALVVSLGDVSCRRLAKSKASCFQDDGVLTLTSRLVMQERTGGPQAPCLSCKELERNCEI